MMDEQAMYDALPPDQQRKIEQGYQRALIIAQDLRAEGERYAALCDAIEDAVANAESRQLRKGGQ